MKGYEAVAKALVDQGVDTVFGIPGDGINGVIEALRVRQEKIRFIQVRHEEAAAFMASGIAKHTGRLGVCAGTTRSRQHASCGWALRGEPRLRSRGVDPNSALHRGAEHSARRFQGREQANREHRRRVVPAAAG